MLVQALRDAESPSSLTIEQIVGHAQPTEVNITPDGMTIAYTLRPISRDGEHGTSAIWVVPFAEGETRQFTSGLTADESPRWSPDGDRLAFVSDRAERGKSSVYVMMADGGEGIRVFEQQGSISRLSWSPDGTKLGFVYAPGETDADKKRKEQREDWTVWDGDPKYSRLWIVELTTRTAQALSPEARQVWGFAWSPDGTRIAINTTPTPRLDDMFLTTDVSILAVDGSGSTSAFTLTGLAADMIWSPDGTRIAYRAASDRVIDEEYVYSRPVVGGEPVCLTPDYDGTAVFLTRIGSGSALLLQTVEGVNSCLYALDWEGNRRPVLDGDPWGVFQSRVGVSNDGLRVAGVWEDGRNAPDIWVATTRGHTPEALLTRRTHLNPALEAALPGETEIVRWESDPGIDVEGLLVKPVGYQEGQRCPLIVQVHGGPTWAWPNAFYASWHDWAQLLAGAGYAVLMPNPRGSTGRGPAWINAIYGDVGGGEYRDMLAGVDAMVERGIADPERLGIGGWSWGGYMTAWTVSQTTRFKAAVMGAGLPNMISDNSLGDIPSANLSYFESTPYHNPDPYYERSAIRYIRNATTPTLILHGEADKRVHPAQGIEMYIALRTLGVKTQFVSYPRQEHGIEERKHQSDLLRRVVGWFDEHLMHTAVEGNEAVGE